MSYVKLLAGVVGLFWSAELGARSPAPLPRTATKAKLFAGKKPFKNKPEPRVSCAVKIPVSMSVPGGWSVRPQITALLADRVGDTLYEGRLKLSSDLEFDLGVHAGKAVCWAARIGVGYTEKNSVTKDCYPGLKAELSALTANGRVGCVYMPLMILRATPSHLINGFQNTLYLHTLARFGTCCHKLKLGALVSTHIPTGNPAGEIVAGLALRLGGGTKLKFDARSRMIVDFESARLMACILQHKTANNLKFGVVYTLVTKEMSARLRTSLSRTQELAVLGAFVHGRINHYLTASGSVDNQGSLRVGFDLTPLSYVRSLQ